MEAFMSYRYDKFGGGFNPMDRFARATAVKSLIIANVVVYVIELIVKGVAIYSHHDDLYFSFVKLFGLVPESITTRFFLWQFVTAMFMHAEFMHIFFNMLGLFFFGPEL